MGPLDRLWIRRLRAACEIELTCRGGEELVRDARTEASWYADLHHPVGAGDRDDARVIAWISILVARTGVARGTPPVRAGRIAPLDGCPLGD